MRYAIILGLIIFSVCLAYSLYFQIKPTVDAAGYDRIAVNFLEGKGFFERTDIPVEKDRAIVRVGQSYVLFLALIYKIFGHHYPVVWVIQALLHTLASLLLFFICLNIFKQDIANRIGLLTMGIYGFWPDLVETTAMLLTETFFLFLTVLTVYLIIKFFQNPDIKKAILVNIIISLAALNRPTILLFSLIFITIILFKKDFAPQKRFVHLIPFIVIPIIILGSWMSYNYLVHGRFILCTTGGYDLWVGNNINANGEMEPSDEIRSYFGRYGFVNIDRKGISEVKKFALEHPFRFLKLQLIKTSKYFSLIRPTGWWSHLNKVGKSLTLLFSGLFGAIGFIFGISGMWKAFKGKDFFHRLLIYLAVCGPVAVIPIVVGTRYRYQLYPFLAIFAAYFLILFLFQGKKYLYKIPLIVFIILFLNSVYDLVTDFNVFIAHLHRII